MRTAAIPLDARTLILAGLAAAAIALAPRTAPALAIDALPDYDGTFSTDCGGVACDIAVAEARAGDGNASTEEPRELGIGTNTAIDPADRSGFAWDGTAYGFSLSYDSPTDRLAFTVGSTEIGFTVDLGPVLTLFIRARGTKTGDVVLSDLSLDGTGLGTLSGDESADYLRVADFDWDSDWSLTGNILMPSGGRNSAPSAQFKLTTLDGPDPTGVPEPATLALLGAGLVGAGLAGRRLSR